MSSPTPRAFPRAWVAAALAVVAGFVASPALARARVCVDAFGAGGCLSTTTCWHFDDYGNWAGTVRIDYGC